MDHGVEPNHPKWVVHADLCAYLSGAELEACSSKESTAKTLRVEVRISGSTRSRSSRSHRPGATFGGRMTGIKKQSWFTMCPDWSERVHGSNALPLVMVLSFLLPHFAL